MTKLAKHRAVQRYRMHVHNVGKETWLPAKRVITSATSTLQRGETILPLTPTNNPFVLFVVRHSRHLVDHVARRIGMSDRHGWVGPKIWKLAGISRVDFCRPTKFRYAARSTRARLDREETRHAMVQVKFGDTVRIHYNDKLKDGTVFDTSDGDDPPQFRMGDNTIIPDLEAPVVGGREHLIWSRCPVPTRSGRPSRSVPVNGGGNRRPLGGRYA